MGEKLSCDKLDSGDCPDACPGLLESRTLKILGGADVIVQVCPNPDTIGAAPTEIDYSVNGEDTVVVHQGTLPTGTEYYNYARNFGQ